MDEQLGRLQFIRTVSGLGILFLLLAWESAAPFILLFERKWRDRARHAGRNFSLGIINAGLSAGATVALWSWAAQWASLHRFGLLNWLGLSLWPHALGAIASFDLWMYWWHRANHRVGLLWRFHRTHHSDPKMDVTTAHRFHFGEILFSSLLRVPVILLVGIRLWELVCYETLLFAVVQLHHANVALAPKLDRWLRVLIVTPTIHKVHHSRFQPETDSNYSSLFSLWDRLFHTLKLRPDPATIEFGLKEFDSKETQTFLGLLKTPWGRKVRREA